MNLNGMQGLNHCLFLNSLFTDHPEIPSQTGKLRSLSKFDASFFSVHYKQAQTMDPQIRLLLERTYEAVVDAGRQFYNVLSL